MAGWSYELRFTIYDLGTAGVLFAQVVADVVARQIRQSVNSALWQSVTHVLPDGDEFHFGRDDAGTGVGELGDDLAGFGAENLPLRQGGLVEVE